MDKLRCFALHTFALLAVAVLLSTTGVDRAHAGALDGPLTIINQPAGCTSTSTTPCPEDYQFVAGTGTSNVAVTAAPTTYTVSDAFNQAGATYTASDFGASVYVNGAKCPSNPNCLDSNPLLTWNFQDNYDFTTALSGPLVQGAALSFSVPAYGVGLTNLQARIVSFSPNQSPASQLVSTSQVTVVDGWRSVGQQSGALDVYTTTLATTPLNPNTEYVLQIRGEAFNAASYEGSVTFLPVPVPPALLLLASGLAGLSRRLRPRSRLAI